MSANDEIDSENNLPVSALPVEPEISTVSHLQEEDDDAWMDVHKLNVVPWKTGPTIQVTFVPGGRIKPLPHPGAWDRVGLPSIIPEYR